MFCNKYLILCIVLICLSILHHNNATKYYGWNMSITRAGIKQIHYTFETIVTNNSSFVQFDFDPRKIIGFPNVEDVMDWVELSLCNSRLFPSIDILPSNLRVTVYLQRPTIQYAIDKKMLSFFYGVKQYFQVKPSFDEIITHGIRRGSFSESIMNYFYVNFNFFTNMLTDRNLIRISVTGLTIVYRSTLEQFVHLKELESKLYYVKVGGGTSRDILFATLAHCFSMRRLVKLSIIMFILKGSKKKLQEGSVYVENYPCFSGGSFIFYLDRTDKDDICLQHLITEELTHTSYFIGGEFNLKACKIHLRRVLRSPILCGKVELCWLNFDKEIFAEPTIKHFYLIDYMYDNAYSSQPYTIFQLNAIILSIIDTKYHGAGFINATEQTRLMYVLTICQTILESINVRFELVTFQAISYMPSFEGIYLDVRVRELIPALHIAPID